MTLQMDVPFPCCHGCGGKGWVDTKKGAQICPICHGKGYLDGTEKSGVTWTA